MKRKRTT